MLQIFLAFALIASAITTNKFLLEYFPPIFFVGIRMLAAGIMLWAITHVKKNKISIADLKKDALSILLIITCTTYIPAICKSFALKYMASSQVAFFGTLDPFITALYAYILFNEKLTTRKITGICIAIFGAIILLTHANQISYFKAFSFVSYPEIAALLSVAIGRYGWILVQSLLREHRYNPMQLNSITMIGSGILSLLTSFFFEREPTRSIAFTPLFIFLISYTIIIGNVISLTLYASLLKQYQATLLSLAGFSVPLFVYFYGWIFLHEPLSHYFFISLGLSLIGFIIFAFDDIQKAFKRILKRGNS